MSGGQQYMQQNTRLVVLTLEVASCPQAPLLPCDPLKMPAWPDYLLCDMDLQWASTGVSWRTGHPVDTFPNGQRVDTLCAGCAGVRHGG